MVRGADQSSWAAEFDALIHLLAAAQRAGRNVTVIIDNRSVLDALCRLLQDTFVLPKYGFGRWVDARRYLLGRAHRAFWVPSHGKRPQWTASADGPGSSQQWREANNAADQAAARGAARQVTRYQLAAFDARCEEAEAWAARALQRLHDAAEVYTRQEEGD